MSRTTPIKTQDHKKAKSRIAKALTLGGVTSFFFEDVGVLRARATRMFGPPEPGEVSVDYFNRVSSMTPRAKATTTGQVVPPRAHAPLRADPWRPHPHLRAAEIDALPSLISAAGTSNKPSLGGQEGRS